MEVPVPTFKLLRPILASELCIVAFVWLIPSEMPPIEYGLLFASLVLLPFVLGMRLRTAGNSLAKCAMWGPVISCVGVLWATASAVIGTTTWGELLAFVVVTVLIGVVPQLCFSYLGAKYGKTLFRFTP